MVLGQLRKETRDKNQERYLKQWQLQMIIGLQICQKLKIYLELSLKNHAAP